MVHPRDRALARPDRRRVDRPRVATRTADSLTVAAATSRQVRRRSRLPNRWSTISRTGGRDTGRPRFMPAAAATSRSLDSPGAGALFVEAHFAFVEPQPWFAGNPILRSKFSVICQDQVRQLRREIQKRRHQEMTMMSPEGFAGRFGWMAEHSPRRAVNQVGQSRPPCRVRTNCWTTRAKMAGWGCEVVPVLAVIAPDDFLARQRPSRSSRGEFDPSVRAASLRCLPPRDTPRLILWSLSGS